MNIVKIITSRLGAVSKAGALGASVTLGLVGMNFYSYMTSSPAAQQRQIRSLAQIISSGGELPQEYSAIKLSRGNVQFATPDEIAAREGALFDGGEASVQRLENLNRISVQGRGLGAGEAGLGMGANEAVALDANGRPITGNVFGDGNAVGAAAARVAGKGGPGNGPGQEDGKTPINKLGDEPSGGLKRASMARATGNNLGSGPGAGNIFGAPSSKVPPVNAARGEGISRVGPSSITGALPSGSQLLAATPDMRGTRSASYVPPSRQAHMAHGVDSKEGRSLREMAVVSGKVAANAHRAANEGAAPFMAQEQLAGGVVLDDSTGETLPTEGIGNDSFGEDQDIGNKLDNLDTSIDELSTYEQDRQAHRDRLTKTLIGLIGATFMAMMAIDALVRQGTWWSYALAGVLSAVMLGAIIYHGVDASNYARAYDEPTTNWLHWGMGGLLAVGIGLAWVSGSKNQGFMKSVSTFLNKNLGMQLLSNTILGTLSSMGITQTIETVKGVHNFDIDDINEQKELHDKLKNE